MSTTLCQHCQAVSLDDEKLGGTAFTPEDGEPFLHFGRGVEGSEGHFSSRVGGDREDEFPDLPGLRLSAANGCSLCGLLRSVILSNHLLQKFSREGPDTSSKILVLKNFEYQWLSLRSYSQQKNSLAYLAFLSVIAVVQKGPEYELSRHIHFEICAPPGPLATWLRIPWNSPDENALSPGRIRDIKSWISDCEQNCHHAGITEKLPTRLIDVGSEDGRDQIRLILSSDIQTFHRGAESCKYATLSYCWGDRTSRPFFTTEKSTLQQLLRSIPMECIPCTFRDAVVVTRSLGIRYLWIDALCIVQDDSEDWTKESAVMGRIYTNSYVTLVALQGESCHDGFLDRKTTRKVPIYYKSSLKPHINGIYWLRHVSSHYVSKRRTSGNSGAIAYDTKISRWSKRGWTLQEEKLSVRKVMFGSERVYYDCGVSFRAENMDRLWALQSWSSPFLDSVSKDLGPTRVYLEWYAVVGSYSGRGLTYSTDRLPAISGLAKTIHERIGGNYLAGLWKSDLFNGLLWISGPWKRSVMSGATFVDSLVHPKHYIAPSWSWARTQNKAYWICYFPRYQEFVSEIEILGATTALVSPNPFGGVKDGHLVLRGRAFGLEGAHIFGIAETQVDIAGRVMKWFDGNIWSDAIRHNGFEIARCVLDWKIPEAASGFELCEAPWDQLVMLIIASHSIDDKDREEGEQENSPEEDRDYFGLLLLPTSEEADSWVRVGVFVLRNDKQGRTVLDNCSERVVRVV